MARVTLENVTTEYKGEQIAGRYLVDKGTVVVFYAAFARQPKSVTHRPSHWRELF